MRKPRELHPTALLRQHTLARSAPSTELDFAAGRLLLHDSFVSAVAACRVSLWRDVFVWQVPCAWLPPGWHRISACHLTRAQAVTASSSPILSTLAARLNWAYRYHGRLVARLQAEEANAETDTLKQMHLLRLTQAVRLFINNHCALVWLVELHGVTSDEEFRLRIIDSAADPAWDSAVPDDACQLISDALLPRALNSVVYDMNLATRATTTKARTTSLEIIGKALPQPSARRTMANVIDMRCNDPQFVRTMIYLMACTLLGVYQQSSALPLPNMWAQTAIWQLVTATTRQEWIAFLSSNTAQMLVLFACREFICDAVDGIPCVAAIAYSWYDWHAYKQHAYEACQRIRKSVARHVYGRTAVRAPVVDQRVWGKLAAELAAMHKNHAYDQRIVKASTSSLVPKMERARRYYAGKVASAGASQGVAEVTNVSAHVWQTVCRQVQECAWFIAANVHDMRQAGLGDYDTRVMLIIAEDYQSGSMQVPDIFQALSPAGFEIVYAYLVAHKTVSHAYLVPMSMRVANQQRLALARLHRHSPLQPLPDNVLCSWYCSRCQRLKSIVSTGSGRRSRSALGIRGSVCLDETCGDVPLCSTKCNGDMCAYPLRRLYLVGYSLKIGRASWTICCGCGLLHKWDTPHSVNGYPICSLSCADYPELYLRDKERARVWRENVQLLMRR